MDSTQINFGSNLDPHLWTITLALPNACYHTVARFRNRQDAEDHLRALRKFVPKAKFEIVFVSAFEQSVDASNYREK